MRSSAPSGMCVLCSIGHGWSCGLFVGHIEPSALCSFSSAQACAREMTKRDQELV